MKVLVTGGGGQLGHDVKRALEVKKHLVFAPTHNEMDITSQNDVNHAIFSFNPDCVIHCAAWTNVDLAEDEEEKCRAVNVLGTYNITNCCKILDIPIVYISTDYVFDGSGTEPWKITDEPNPQNVYGLSKYDGEKIVISHSKFFVIRISWVFGINGNNFVKKMIELSKTRNELSVVSDQIGSPTYTADLAQLISEMILTNKFGIYHACNQGFCSWFDFTKKIMEYTGSDTVIKPINSDAWPSKVKRPKNSRLDTSSLKENGFNPLPPWDDALKRFIQQLGI